MRSAVLLAAALAACNFGRQDLPVTVRLPLTSAECAELQDPARGGSEMAATFVAVAGAEFPPLTELKEEVTPCLPPSEDPGSLGEIEVKVPEGDRRAIALAILGKPLGLTGLALPAIELEGLPLRLRDPRPVFFGGGRVLDRADLLSGEITLEMHPFVNLIGRVLRGTSPAAARVTFFLPRADGACVTPFESESAPAFETLVTVSAGEGGRFFASVPYRATEEFCPDNQGNEVFALAETERGEVALLVPGRAETRSSGIEPGILLEDVVMILHQPGVVSPLERTLVTGVARLPYARFLKLYLSGWGLDAPTFAVQRPLTLVRIDDAGGELERVVGRLDFGGVTVLGTPPGAAQPLRSYERLRRFADRAPSVVFVRFTDVLGDDLALNPGTWRVADTSLPFNLPSFRIRP